jgi:hypothetical protein
MALLGYWPPAAHLALVAACAVTAWWRLETAPVVPSGAAVPADLAAPAPAIAAAAVDTGARDSGGDVEAVAARALFRPGRLAAADEAEAVEAEAPAVPDDPADPAPLAELRMVGFVDQGGRRSAILVSVEDGQSHIVHEGDEIAGARVRQISPGAVVIESAGRRITVELYPDD